MSKIFSRLICSVIVLGGATALFAAQRREGVPTVHELFHGASTLSVRYFEPTRERRTIRSVGDIDTGFDIQIIVNCDGGDCAGTLRSLPRLLSSIRARERCPRPYYARMDLLRGGTVAGVIYVDYTGRCIDSGNRSYGLDGDLLQALAATPPRDW